MRDMRQEHPIFHRAAKTQTKKGSRTRKTRWGENPMKFGRLVRVSRFRDDPDAVVFWGASWRVSS